MTETPETTETTETTGTPETNDTPTRATRELNRREVLLLAAGLGISAAAGTWVWNRFLVLEDPLAEVKHTNGTGPHWIMVIDLETCIGCQRCAYACQATNDTHSDHLWNIVLHDEDTFEKPVFLPRPCMHCEHAPCVEVCPVGATYHREDGLVEMDYQRCIGCRYCMVACPYGSRVFNWEENKEPNPQVPTWGTIEAKRRPRGVVEKCTFCSHRLDGAEERGLRPGYDQAATPACCVVCPTEARRFGDMKDPDSPAAQALK
ncbi:MAG: 4Fe-4S dicluster domain-containing protein, partial [Anaerolineae bacterium]|nr:4Fe-4S dicluster domain-containing protein [Anaerolineae bacterium]